MREVGLDFCAFFFGGLSFDPVEQLRHLLGGYLAEDPVVDRDHGSQAANTQATGAVQREETVFGGLGQIHAQFGTERVQDLVCALDKTGGPQTNRNGELAARLQAEKMVEGGHAADKGFARSHAGAGRLRSYAQWRDNHNVAAACGAPRSGNFRGARGLNKHR